MNFLSLNTGKIYCGAFRAVIRAPNSTAPQKRGHAFTYPIPFGYHFRVTGTAKRLTVRAEAILKGRARNLKGGQEADQTNPRASMTRASADGPTVAASGIRSQSHVYFSARFSGPGPSRTYRNNKEKPSYRMTSGMTLVKKRQLVQEFALIR